jgi:hypothetical protein
MPLGISIQRSYHTSTVYRLSCPADTIVSTVSHHSSTIINRLLRSYRRGLFDIAIVADLPPSTTL